MRAPVGAGRPLKLGLLTLATDDPCVGTERVDAAQRRPSPRVQGTGVGVGDGRRGWGRGGDGPAAGRSCKDKWCLTVLTRDGGADLDLVDKGRPGLGVRPYVPASVTPRLDGGTAGRPSVDSVPLRPAPRPETDKVRRPFRPHSPFGPPSTKD